MRAFGACMQRSANLLQKRQRRFWKNKKRGTLSRSSFLKNLYSALGASAAFAASAALASAAALAAAALRSAAAFCAALNFSFSSGVGMGSMALRGQALA